MDVAPVEVGVARVHQPRLLREVQGALDGLELADVGPVDLGRDALEERVGRLVALLELVAHLRDVVGEALLEGDDLGQHLPGGPLVAPQELEHLLHLR